MRKIFCDLCGEERSENDMHDLKITKADKPSITPKEICVFCVEKVKDFLAKITKEVA